MSLLFVCSQLFSKKVFDYSTVADKLINCVSRHRALSDKCDPVKTLFSHVSAANVQAHVMSLERSKFISRRQFLIRTKLLLIVEIKMNL